MSAGTSMRFMIMGQAIGNAWLATRNLRKAMHALILKLWNVKHIIRLFRHRRNKTLFHYNERGRISVFNGIGASRTLLEALQIAE